MRGVGRDNVGLVLDTFHLGRSGCTIDELSAIPADRIFHVQLCDAPLQPRIDDYFEEAVTIRDFAGEGELGVREMARCLEEMGALDNVGPEVFSGELHAMDAADVGRLCRAKTDEFLSSIHAAHGGLGELRCSTSTDVTVSFGGVVALVDVDLCVPAGRIVGLIGPNGAGKTTCVDAISGFVVARAGSSRAGTGI